VRFEWDEEKARTNQFRHGVSFEEATELLGAENESLEIFDSSHSDDEDRFISIGPIARGLALVVWTEREDGVVRIVSARWATKREQDLFHRTMDRES